MKLGEALSERARLQRKVGELRQRINSNAATQEGTAPAENPVTLLDELIQVFDELETLIARINTTNARTEVEPDTTMTQALAHRDQLSGLISCLRDAAKHGQEGAQEHRYMRSELKLERHVDVAALQRRADVLAVDLRRLDNEIQQVNWSTDLV